MQGVWHGADGAGCCNSSPWKWQGLYGIAFLFVAIVCFVYSDSFENFTFHSSLDVL
jgi:hypothetical protein